ncbi:MAG TPA: hypothetical protein VF499_04745 [Afipia sp.]
MIKAGCFKHLKIRRIAVMRHTEHIGAANDVLMPARGCVKRENLQSQEDGLR